MINRIIFYVGAILLFFFLLRTYEAIPIEEREDSITCGIYSEEVETYIQKPFEVKGGILETTINDNKVYVLIERVHTKMCRDNGVFPRYHVEVLFNNNKILLLSHIDIPFALNVHYDNVKYRVICVDNN